MATARFNWPAVLGPLLAVAGFLSYFTLFYRWPVLRDIPWANYALLAAAVALSIAGLRRARQRGGAARRVFGAVGMLLSGAVALLFVWYIVSMSRELPDVTHGLALGAPLPAVTLPDPSGAPVALAELPQPLVIVFYRGFW